MENRLSTNQSAPKFKVETQLGMCDSEEYFNDKCILFFYPRDNTSGCTIENNDFKCLYDKFKALGVEVIGISRDSLKSHINFAKKHELPFHLIPDPSETICEQYGVMVEKNMYGKKCRGIERSTFYIKNGKIQDLWRKVTVDGHAESILNHLSQENIT